MIIVDIEASGSSISQGSIVELAALDFDNPNDVFSEKCRVFDGVEIEEGAKKVLGVTDDLFFTDSKKQTVDDLMHHFMKWLEPKEDRTFAGAYIGFDISMFRTQLRRMNEDFTIGYGVMELNTLVFVWCNMNDIQIQFKDYSIRGGISGVLNNNYVGIDLERKAHTAIEDVELTAEIFSRILYGKKLLPKYDIYNLPKNFKSIL